MVAGYLLTYTQPEAVLTGIMALPWACLGWFCPGQLAVVVLKGSLGHADVYSDGG